MRTLILLFVLLVTSIHGQIQTINPNESVSTGPAKLNANFTYLDTYKVGTNRANTYGAFLQRFDAALFIPPLRTVGTLPSAASSINYTIVVTNGLTASDCTVGGGTAKALCISNGAAWVPLGGSAGITALTGDVTGAGTGSVATTIANAAVTLAKMADLANGRIICRTTSGTGVPEACATLPTAAVPAFTGDVTTPGASLVNTLATVNSNTGACGDATHVCRVTLNAKGLATAASAVAITTGLGDVVGPSSATDNCFPRFDTTTGKLIQNSVVCADDSGNITGANSIAVGTSPPALTPGTGTAWNCTEGTAPSVGPAAGVDVSYCDSTAHNILDSLNNGPYYPQTHTIASGAKALATASIASNTCATVQTATATGTLSTDRIIFTPNASIKAVTGYTPGGTISIVAYPTADTVNFDVCNRDQSSAVTPGAVTLNWEVLR